MRTLTLVLLASLATAPAALALDATDRFDGTLVVETRVGAPRCRAPGDGTLELWTDATGTRGTVHVDVASPCPPPRFAAEARLAGDGWQLGDGQRVHGLLTPLDEEARFWAFRLDAGVCPPNVICEFPLVAFSYEGVLERMQARTQ